MKQRILSHLRKTPRKTHTFKTLARHLDAQRGASLHELKKALAALEEEARITKESGRYGCIEAFGFARGTLDVKRKGFAFLIPESGEGKDLYIPRGRIKDALHKDLVLAKITRRRGYMLDEAEVVKVLNRHRETFVATVRKKNGKPVLVPDERALQEDFVLADDDRKHLDEDDKVLARIVRYNTFKRHEATVVRRLGKKGDKGLDIESKILEHGIEPAFPEAVLEEARTCHPPQDDSLAQRRDLRDTLTLTIDGEDAKDFDDALSAEAAEEGRLVIGVHIADVSHYVERGTALDEEAKRRGTSIYLPDRVIPMLPGVLSEEVCSLNEGVNRLTMSCVMTIDEAGRIVDVDLFESVIRSHKRLTYEALSAETALDDMRDVRLKSVLERLKEAAARLRRARFKNGSLDLETPEAKVILDENGRAVDVRKVEPTVFSNVVEELMLAANKTVADMMKKRNHLFIYRIHDVPEEERVQAFFTVLDALGMTHPQRRITRNDLQLVSARLKEKDPSGALAILLVRALPRAVYSIEPKGHYGLAFEHYTHFTSPIRRYPDLLVHRLLKGYLLKQGARRRLEHDDEATLAALAEDASVKERAAADLEYNVIDMKKAELMSAHIGRTFTGTITSVTPFGFYVTLQNGIEGLVHISELDDDYYDYDEHTLRLIGRDSDRTYALTDSLDVRVSDVDIDEGTVDFVPTRS